MIVQLLPCVRLGWQLSDSPKFAALVPVTRMLVNVTVELPVLVTVIDAGVLVVPPA